jgi:gliding motility-associated lipoprotein GldJ
MKRTLLGLSLLCVGTATIFSACSSKTKGVSDKTGWNYNDPRLGGFDVANYPGQQTGPGLVPVEGGSFTMGQTEEDVTYEHNNTPRTVTVSSFYMDETEVANVHYREYIYWLQRSYAADYPEEVAKALPDSTVWRAALSYNEPMVTNYFRHAAYNNYPVVGVNWYQANAYCQWRTDRVNEMILIKNGMLKKNQNQVNEDVFNSESYTTGQYLGTPGKNQKRDLDPNGAGKRNTTYADGFLLPAYRLPTEAEWEFAALGLIENNPSPRTKRRRGEEAITDRKVYPWGDVRSTRSQGKGEYRGEYNANYKKSYGNAMGTPGGLNDDASKTAPVYSYAANAYGLYNMAGNVSEWTLDVYRATSSQDVNDIDPYRGNEFYKNMYEADGTMTEKDSLGNLTKIPVDSNNLAGRFDRDYTGYDARSVQDGDSLSGYTYDYGKTSLVNNDSRVIKGASWNDRAYWLSPGTRRFMQAGHASATVGFRCVMDRLGSAGFNNDPGGNYFGKRKARK